MTESPTQDAPTESTQYFAPTKTNTLAIVALIAAFFFAPAGIICGFIARSQIRATKEQGDGLALAAILVGTVAILIWVCAAIFAVTFFNHFDHIVFQCLTPMPPVPAPGLHWICSGNNTWISSGG